MQVSNILVYPDGTYELQYYVFVKVPAAKAFIISLRSHNIVIVDFDVAAYDKRRECDYCLECVFAHVEVTEFSLSINYPMIPDERSGRRLSRECHNPDKLSRGRWWCFLSSCDAPKLESRFRFVSRKNRALSRILTWTKQPRRPSKSFYALA